MSVRDVIIIGAGPSGLAAAIAAKEHGLDYQVLEQGVLVNSIYRFPPNMIFFTTPELLEIGGLPLVSPFEKPTRIEALRYYRRVVDTYDLRIAYQETVVSVTREDEGSRGSQGSQGSQGSPGSDVSADWVFGVETSSSKGVRRVRHARNVIFAHGYYDHPVMLGIPGEDLPHVFHYYSEPHPFYRQRVVVVGGGNSAAEASLELYRAGAHVTLVHRSPQLKSTIKYWVRPDIENRIKEGSVAARLNTCIREIRPTSVVVTSSGRTPAPLLGSGPNDEFPSPPTTSTGDARGMDEARVSPDSGREEEIAADAVFLLTGYRADTGLMERAGIRLTEREGPLYDPVTFETNVRGIFVAGGALAGVDTGTVFIENGRFHGKKIVEVIAGRLD